MTANTDPTLDLHTAARAAESAAEAGARLNGGDIPNALANAADAALHRAYRTQPTTLAGIAALGRLVLDVEDCDPEIATALASIERAALALSRS